MQAPYVPTVQSFSAIRFPGVLIAWLGVNFADSVLTYVLLGRGGIEGNPILSQVQGIAGPLAMLATKLGLAVLVGGALTKQMRFAQLRLATVLMGLVTLYNAVLLSYIAFPQMGIPFIV